MLVKLKYIKDFENKNGMYPIIFSAFVYVDYLGGLQ